MPTIIYHGLRDLLSGWPQKNTRLAARLRGEAISPMRRGGDIVYLCLLTYLKRGRGRRWSCARPVRTTDELVVRLKLQRVTDKLAN